MGGLEPPEPNVSYAPVFRSLKVLNVPSEYREQVINDMLLLPPILELDYPPTDEELSQALSKLKNRKPGGNSGILSELIHCEGCELEERILEQMWEEGCVVDDWKECCGHSNSKEDTVTTGGE